MTEFSTIDDFWNAVISLGNNKGRGPSILFRGITNKEHLLIPSIGRNTEKNTRGEISTLEDLMLEEFKRLAAPIIESNPSNDFEWLFLAQHYGLPTRLLDWSSNPLVALYFAIERHDQTDGAMYYYTEGNVTDQYEIFDYRTADYSEEFKKNPVSIFAAYSEQGHVIFVRPKYTDQRYLNQKSIFSCPKNPYEELLIPNENKLIIKGEWKHELRCRLRRMGVSTSFIYPGLGGIASEVKAFEFDQISSGKVQIITGRAIIES